MMNYALTVLGRDMWINMILTIPEFISFIFMTVALISWMIKQY